MTYLPFLSGPALLPAIDVFPTVPVNVSPGIWASVAVAQSSALRTIELRISSGVGPESFASSIEVHQIEEKGREKEVRAGGK